MKPHINGNKIQGIVLNYLFNHKIIIVALVGGNGQDMLSIMIETFI